MPLSTLLRLALGIGLLACTSLFAEEKTVTKENKQSNPATAAAAEKDKKNPPGPVTANDNGFILIDQIGEALRLVPRAIILKPEKYKELLDEIERLKAMARPNRAVPPSSCILKGKVEGSIAQLQAQFDFATDQPNAFVFVACGAANIITANLDGATVIWRPDGELFTLQVEKAGNHKLVLELALQLTARGGGLSLELDLPRTPSTSLELELPAGTRDMRIGGKQVAAPSAFQDNRLKAQLGSVDRLDISWKDSKSAGGSTPLLSADGSVQVRIEDQLVTTTAELTLAVQGGLVREWRMLVPAGAELKTDLARVQPVESKPAPGGSLQTIRFKEATLEPLRVTLTVQSPVPKPGSPLALGPFYVLGAARQSGTVLVSNGAADLRPQLLARTDLFRRPITEAEQRADPNLIAAFTYRTMGSPEKAAPLGPPPWLDVVVENVRGLLETRMSHSLSLQRRSADQLYWHVVSTLDGTPIRTGVDYVEIVLPTDFAYDKQRGPQPAELIKHTELDDAGRQLTLKLNANPIKPFQVNVTGNYGQTANATGRTVLALPIPRQTRDRGGVITINAPEDIELVAPDGANFQLDLVSREPQSVKWIADHLPDKVEIGWKPYRPEVRAVSVVDVTLGPRDGQVRHQMRLQFVRTPPANFTVRIPAALTDRLSLLEGGQLGDAHNDGSLRTVRLLGAAGKEHVLNFVYSFSLEPRASEKSLTVPLVLPEAVASGETKVRIWSDPGNLPQAPGGSWTEWNIEEAKGRDRLPVLVLRSQRVDATLTLPVSAASGGTDPVVLIDRALVRAYLQENGGQAYHASFMVRQIAANSLDLELPSTLSALALRVTLDGKQLDWENAEEGNGRVARLRIGRELVRQPSVLDVWYQVPAARTGSSLLRSQLQPPLLRMAQDQAPVRWQIQIPAGWLPLAPECGPGGERSWSFQNRLLTPHLTVTHADLERWFAGPEMVNRTAGYDTSAAWPSQIYWQNGLEPVTVTHVPQLPWFLVCSLAVLLVGRGLARLTQPETARPLPPSTWFLPAFALLSVALAVAWLLFPMLLAAIIYGGQIGFAVLLVWLVMELLLRERYRRQVVFLPSFSRPRKGSSMVRSGGSSVRQRSVPSTVDAPSPAATDHAIGEGPS